MGVDVHDIWFGCCHGCLLFSPPKWCGMMREKGKEDLRENEAITLSFSR